MLQERALANQELINAHTPHKWHCYCSLPTRTLRVVQRKQVPLATRAKAGLDGK